MKGGGVAAYHIHDSEYISVDIFIFIVLDHRVINYD